MNQTIFTVNSNKKVAKDVYELKLSGDTSEIKASGQFVNLKIDGLFLRRPLSVCDYDKDSLTLIYKVVGEGTKKLTEYSKNDKIDILVGDRKSTR